MEISQQVFSDIQGIFQQAGSIPDLASFTNQIIRFLFKQIFAESSVVHFPSEQKYSKGDIEINLDQTYVRQYKEYYYLFDPVNWIDEFTQHPVVSVEDFIDYPQFMDSRFYNDFLIPQHIHHKLYLNLYSGFNHHARIGLYRSPNCQRFSKKEIVMLKLIVPYLGHAIEHHKLLEKNRLQSIFFNLLEENSAKGIILLDASMRLVYMNRAAKEFCRMLNLENAGGSAADHLPETLIEDCRTLVHQSLSNPAGTLPLTCHRTFSLNGAQSIQKSSRIVFEEVSSEKERFFLIYLEEKKSALPSSENLLKNHYHLTIRECEIVHYLFEGLKNTEIAKRVFLSEITVKKHLQSIYKKLQVSNRAAAVRKIAEAYQSMV